MSTSESQLPPRTSPGQPVEARLRGARIIIADDDADCRDLLELALGTGDNEVLAASNGGELLELIAEHGPCDLIVTDINMPWMYGSQVLASIREAGVSTPVVVVTGLSCPDLPESIARIGRARLVRKPFTIAELRAAIAELVALDSRA